MIHEVVADGLVPVGLDGDAQLGAHPVRARDEHRALEVGGNAIHAAEPPERTTRTGREGRLDDGADASLDRIRPLDVHPGRRVVECPVLTHAALPSSASKATSRRNSATLASMSPRVISSRRWTENFSTANDPIADPTTTARRRFASLRSPVCAK